MILRLLVCVLGFIDYSTKPIDLKVTRIVIFDHLNDEELIPMYRELICFDDYGWVIGGVVVKPDAAPLKEYVFRQKFSNKRWRLRFQNQSYTASTLPSREVFPKQADNRFLLKEGY